MWYTFSAYISDSSKKHEKRSNSDLVVIPGGLTTVVRPLYFCLNKPFKGHVDTRRIDDRCATLRCLSQ